MTDNWLLAIPVFNEQKHLLNVLGQAQARVPHVLVIDDGSTDSTPELLREVPDVHVIAHLENRGYGKSLADAFCFAQRHDFSWLITMDCDEQHEPSCIGAFLAAADENDADIISGTRYPRGWNNEDGAPADRRNINRLITETLNRRLGLHLTDAFCGFKAYRVSSLTAFEITVPGYAMPMQLWVQAARAGLRIRELPVPLIYNDPTRHFGGLLDDPNVRLQHYLEVMEREIREPATMLPEPVASHCGHARQCSTTSN
jgi:glycosyltransferase involved in cell wall biosynthesis